MYTYVASGVPKGTVMPPLLFLLYSNDLPRNIASQIKLFADDCLVYHLIKTQDNAKVLLQYYYYIIRPYFKVPNHFKII